MYRGLITNRTGKFGRIHVISTATRGGGRAKANLLSYPKLFAYDLLQTFHCLPYRCVPGSQRPTAVSTPPLANHHLHGRCSVDNGAAVVAVAATGAAVAAADTAAVDAAAVVGATADDTAAFYAASAVAAAAAADTAGVDAATVVGAAAADPAGLPYLYPVCPCRVRLGLLFLHPRCPDNPSRQQKGRVPFRISSPSPSPSPSRHMCSAQHPQKPFDLTLP